MQVWYPGPGIAIFFLKLGRDPLSGEVVHPEMMGRRAIFNEAGNGSGRWVHDVTREGKRIPGGEIRPM